MAKHVALTEENIAEIRKVTAQENALAGIAALWRILEPNFAELPAIDPADYAISREDWGKVFDALHGGPGSERPMFGASLAMELANIGPSTIPQSALN